MIMHSLIVSVGQKFKQDTGDGLSLIYDLWGLRSWGLRGSVLKSPEGLTEAEGSFLSKLVLVSYFSSYGPVHRVAGVSSEHDD